MTGATSSVAVGVFDGLHLGHREILGRALARARAGGHRAVVVSFDPHPDVVLSRSFQAAAPLTPHAERRAMLEAMGIDTYEVLPFTRELAALEPEEFVDRHLVRPFAMRDLVVGANFALGRGRSGDIPRLRAIGATRGFGVEPVPLLERDGVPISSTRIRGLLADGRVDLAAHQLGRRYALGGRVVTGDGIGRTLGVPTANLRLPEEKYLPADGIYAARARIGDDAAWRPAAMSIGMRPTFGDQPRTLEVHLLDWSGELVGRTLTVELDSWLRGQVRFDSADALAAAMQDDLRVVRDRLATGSATT